MRWAWIVVLSLAAGRADAGAETIRASVDAEAGNFWRDVIDPYGDAVADLAKRARRALGKAGEATEPDAIERRQRWTDDAYGMLRFARRLSPEDPEILRLLGQAADELGRTRQALDALEACVRLTGPERAGPEVTGRLGAIYLRLGRLDDAVRWLRVAQGTSSITTQPQVAVHLATALAARGEMAAAIDVLGGMRPRTLRYFSESATLVSVALAVHYDRDEQRAAALEVLGHLQTTLQQELGPVAQRALAAMPFAPAEDRYYYQALLYEALGARTEARAQWALYAAFGDAPWRRRALDHVAALDAQPAATLTPKPPVP